MAKPKVKVLVKIRTDSMFDVYINNPERHLSDIHSIEGVTSADLIWGRISIITDPRYDTQEVADEIKELLAAEVPEVFKD